EQAYLLTASADMWLNVGQLKSIEEVKKSCPKMADTRVVKNGYIYNNTLRVNDAGGNDFYESGIMHPDLVLHDLVKIFHPELVDDSPFYYYTKLD
ncbi:MAG: iron ABC transporter substrate-binding protein, partial [Muribaculaceae bacterium]|nr:iron ABC transporter substrate-binding protein [Muribaculaceae bacterium]